MPSPINHSLCTLSCERPQTKSCTSCNSVTVICQVAACGTAHCFRPLLHNYAQRVSMLSKLDCKNYRTHVVHKMIHKGAGGSREGQSSNQLVSCKVVMVAPRMIQVDLPVRRVHLGPRQIVQSRTALLSKVTGSG